MLFRSLISSMMLLAGLLGTNLSFSEPLQWVQMQSIDAPEHLQSSGLAVYQGRLLMVLDKHDWHIFELIVEPHWIWVRS